MKSTKNFIPHLASGFTLVALLFCSAVQANSIKISGPLVSGGDVKDSTLGNSIIITPDNLTVVFLADKDIDGVDELYSVPIDGSSPPIKLHEDLTSGSSVLTDFSVSADSSKVFFYISDGFPSIEGLYMSSVTTGGAQLIYDDFTGVFPQPPLSNSDGSRVVFLGNNNDGLGFFSTNTSDLVTTQLDTQTEDGIAFESGKLTPDGQTFIYSTINNIYSVPIVGGTPVLLSSGESESRFNLGYRISPDGSFIVFIAGQTAENGPEIFSALIDGSSLNKLNGLLSEGTQIGSGYRIDPTSSRVAFTAGRLFSNSIDGSDLRPISRVGLDSSTFSEHAFNEDGSTVVYNAESTTFKVPTLGGASVELTESGQSIGGYSVRPVSDVILGARLTVECFAELVRINIETTSARRVDCLPSLQKLETSPSLNSIGFSSFETIDTEGGLQLQLYVAGGETTNPVSVLPFGEGDAFDFRLSSDDKYLIYMADREIERQFELFSIDLEEFFPDDSVCTAIKLPNGKVFPLCL